LLIRTVKLGISSLFWSLDQLLAATKRLLGLREHNRTVILYYHSVPKKHRQHFANQLDVLLKVAKPIPADLRQGRLTPGLTVVVTFDDGFASVVENAMPELFKRGIPFTIFYPTGSWDSRPNWIKNPQHPSWSERVLSKEELRTIAAHPLVTIASHSINHPNFLRIDQATARNEFTQSRAELERVLGRRVDLFSFPHGAHDTTLVQMALDAGYRGIFTVEPTCINATRDPFLAGRFAVEPDDWSAEFRLKVSGAYRWQAWFRQRKGPDYL
jgi:peptidoglycan/xylan/chitin deacetylase (PgdA/CDA1 family)